MPCFFATEKLFAKLNCDKKTKNINSCPEIDVTFHLVDTSHFINSINIITN